MIDLAAFFATGASPKPNYIVFSSSTEAITDFPV